MSNPTNDPRHEAMRIRLAEGRLFVPCLTNSEMMLCTDLGDAGKAKRVGNWYVTAQAVVS